MKFNRTKIIATLGPASTDIKIMRQMIQAGCNVFRINASHGNHQLQQQAINNVHALNEELKTNVAILYDLQGPKIRIGDIKNNGVELVEGQSFTLTTDDCIGDETKANVRYYKFIDDVKPGERILIDDGRIELLVVSVTGNNVLTTVLDGGTLSSRKGVNLPGTKVSLPSLTEKDLTDLEFILNNNVDWIGLSFVRSAGDVENLKQLIKDKNKTAGVIAKIEKPEAIEQIDEIINVSDGIMVARGDLGVELPLEKVPLIQKSIVKKCIEVSKPVIIATQMMENMINEQFPTRAEVNDVANAVLDGADAVMLSAETSVGKDPVNVIKTMWRIVHTVQQSDMNRWNEKMPDKKSTTFVSDSVLYNACMMAKQCKAKAIVTMTYSGYSALKISSMRPGADVIVFTVNKVLLTKLSLVWGVRTFYYDSYHDTDSNISDVKEILKSDKTITKGDLVVHTYSTPLHERGTANTIKLNVID